MKRGHRWSMCLVYAFLVGSCAVVLVPFYWLLAQSLKSRGEIFAYPPTLLPKLFAWGNYADIFRVREGLFLRSYVNSLLIALCDSVGGVVVCSMAGYAFAKYRFRFRNALFLVVLASMMIPFHVVVVPLFVEIRSFRMLNPLGVILPFLTKPFGVFFMRQYFLKVPDELLEAGRIDGASELSIWARIVMPVAAPACAVLACIFFVDNWNMLLWPLIVLQRQEHVTVQVFLQQLIGARVVEYGALFAGSALAVLPILMLFLLMQKRIIAGLTAGAVKN